MPITPNSLFYSDCLTLLERTANETASLVYLDPPWYTDEGYKSGILNEKKSAVKESKQQRVLLEAEALQEYLNFLSKVLQQTHRVLTPKGILFFHVDLRLSGYVRLLIDEVFEINNFFTEIILPHSRFNNRLRAYTKTKLLIFLYKLDTICS